MEHLQWALYTEREKGGRVETNHRDFCFLPLNKIRQMLVIFYHSFFFYSHIVQNYITLADLWLNGPLPVELFVLNSQATCGEIWSEYCKYAPQALWCGNFHKLAPMAKSGNFLFLYAKRLSRDLKSKWACAIIL